MKLTIRQRKRHQIERADQISWALLVFAVFRMTAWLVMMVLTGLGIAGVASFEWAYRVGSLVVFVAMISYYANFATDLDAATSAWAAIRAGRAHAQGVDTEHTTEAAQAEVLRRVEALAELIHDHQLRQER